MPTVGGRRRRCARTPGNVGRTQEQVNEEEGRRRVINQFNKSHPNRIDKPTTRDAVRPPVLLGGGEAKVRGVQVARVLLAGAPAKRLEVPQEGVPAHRHGRGGVGGRRSGRRGTRRGAGGEGRGGGRRRRGGGAADTRGPTRHAPGHDGGRRLRHQHDALWTAGAVCAWFCPRNGR